jgi:hypothetical protein
MEVITTREIKQAERHLLSAKQAWERVGCRRVSDQEIAEAEGNVAWVQGALRQLSASAASQDRRRLAFLRVLRGTWVAKCGDLAGGCLAGGAVAGTAAAAVTAIPLVLVLGRLVPVLVGLAGSFLFVGAWTAFTLSRPAYRDIDASIDELRQRLERHDADVATARQRLKEWENHLATLRQIRQAQAAFHEAVRRRDWLTAQLSSRRYQLSLRDWRPLRSTKFEDFIADVFEALGFAVEKTKTTGDQGVDLIVRGKGKVIAVQTKGYKGSVGNDSVQQVFTGMAFYRCGECVVITNSRFTRSAVSVAKRVSCRLVDGAQITSLIDGRIY